MRNRLDNKASKNTTSSSIAGYSAPAAGFEAPLEMLSACHYRIERQCATLRRVVPYLAQHGAVIEARSAAANVMRYFDTSAKHHHADEDEDLFPALLESMAGSDPVCLRELTSTLAAEHRELEACWQEMRAVLERVVAGESVLLDSQSIEALVGLYERHIEREESELLPMAARLLTTMSSRASVARCASGAESIRYNADCIFPIGR